MGEVEGRRLLVWIASAKRDLQSTPEAIQDQVGYALGEVQARRDPPLYVERMKGARFRDVWVVKADDLYGATYRTAYVAVLGDDVYVLDTFKKKSTSGIATSQRDLDRIGNRLKKAREIYAERQRKTR